MATLRTPARSLGMARWLLGGLPLALLLGMCCLLASPARADANITILNPANHGGNTATIFAGLTPSEYLINGTAHNLGRVYIFDGATLLGSAEVKRGAWEFRWDLAANPAPSGPAAGDHTINVSATNPATSPTPVTVTIDTASTLSAALLLNGSGGPGGAFTNAASTPVQLRVVETRATADIVNINWAGDFIGTPLANFSDKNYLNDNKNSLSDNGLLYRLMLDANGVRAVRATVTANPPSPTPDEVVTKSCWRNVIVDSVGPTIPASAPTQTKIQQDKVWKFTGTVSDATSGIFAVYMRFYEADGDPYPGILPIPAELAYGASPGAAVTWTARTPWPSNDYKYKVFAVDNAGNVSESGFFPTTDPVTPPGALTIDAAKLVGTSNNAYLVNGTYYVFGTANASCSVTNTASLNLASDWEFVANTSPTPIVLPGSGLANGGVDFKYTGWNASAATGTFSVLFRAYDNAEPPTLASGSPAQVTVVPGFTPTDFRVDDATDSRPGDTATSFIVKDTVTLKATTPFNATAYQHMVQQVKLYIVQLAATRDATITYPNDTTMRLDWNTTSGGGAIVDGAYDVYILVTDNVIETPTDTTYQSNPLHFTVVNGGIDFQDIAGQKPLLFMPTDVPENSGKVTLDAGKYTVRGTIYVKCALQGDANLIQAGTARLRLTWSGGGSANLDAAVVGGVLVAQWDTTAAAFASAATKEITMQMQFSDIWGTVRQSSTQNKLYINNNAPAITITRLETLGGTTIPKHADGNYYITAPVRVVGTCTANLELLKQGASNLNEFVSLQATPAIDPAHVDGSGEAFLSLRWTPPITDQSYTVQLRALDIADNPVLSSPIIVKVDSGAPQVSISAPKNPAHVPYSSSMRKVTVTGQVSDVIGVERWELTVNYRVADVDHSDTVQYPTGPATDDTLAVDNLRSPTTTNVVATWTMPYPGLNLNSNPATLVLTAFDKAGQYARTTTTIYELAVNDTTLAGVAALELKSLTGAGLFTADGNSARYTRVVPDGLGGHVKEQLAGMGAASGDPTFQRPNPFYPNELFGTTLVSTAANEYLPTRTYTNGSVSVTASARPISTSVPGFDEVLASAYPDYLSIIATKKQFTLGMASATQSTAANVNSMLPPVATFDNWTTNSATNLALGSGELGTTVAQYHIISMASKPFFGANLATLDVVIDTIPPQFRILSPSNGRVLPPGGTVPLIFTLNKYNIADDEYRTPLKRVSMTNLDGSLTFKSIPEVTLELRQGSKLIKTYSFVTAVEHPNPFAGNGRAVITGNHTDQAGYKVSWSIPIDRTFAIGQTYTLRLRGMSDIAGNQAVSAGTSSTYADVSFKVGLTY